MEDINNILNSGEVTNLFAADEVDKIVNDLRPELTIIIISHRQSTLNNCQKILEIEKFS
jgi:ABC-type bacteriocin/lantibiotic exporter with double-glycine peptidase domain